MTDLSETFWITLVIAGLLLVSLLLIVVLVTMLVRSNLETTNFSLTSLAVQNEQLESQNQNQAELIQSLLNQVRSMDPMTLWNLQAATATPSSTTPQSNYDESYVGHSDEDEAELIEQQRLASAAGSLVQFGEFLNPTEADEGSDVTNDDDGVRTY